MKKRKVVKRSSKVYKTRLPAKYIIPATLVLTDASFQKVMMALNQEPTDALVELMRDKRNTD